MNESKLEEKKQLGFTKEILDYLKKNPSVAIAVVSAAITIMSILSSYAGRLANITFLKYWGIVRMQDLKKKMFCIVWSIPLYGSQ